MISELDIGVATSIFGLVLKAFWKRALQIYLNQTNRVGYNDQLNIITLTEFEGVQIHQMLHL